MPKLQIIVDILAPSDAINIRFEGKNPFAGFAMFPRVIRDVMKITGKDTFETDVRWDVSGGDNKSFYGMWMGIRTEDRWTKTRIRTLGQGEQSSKTKEGWVTFEIKGTINTDYNYATFVQRAFWNVFEKTFYHKQRRAYTEFAKDNIFDVRDRVLRTLNIERDIG